MPKLVFQKPPVVLRHSLSGIGEYGEGRGPREGLGDVEELDLLSAVHGGRAPRRYLLEHPVEFARGYLPFEIALHPLHQVEYPADPPAREGGDGEHRGVVRPPEPLSGHPLYLLRFGQVVGGQVPLVEQHHKRPVSLPDKLRQAGVVMGGAALAVYHQKRDVRPFYRPYGAKHPVSFDRLVYPGPSPYPRGVDQDVPPSVLLVEGVHRVAGGSGRGAGYEPLLPEHPVDEGGLSDVGLSYDGYPCRPVLPAAAPGERLYVRGYLVHELVDVAVVKGGNGQDFPRSRAVELVRA